MNNINLVGRLTADPKQTTLSTGSVVCEFTVAVNRQKKDADADFFSVKAWGKTAEFCANYLTKGRMVSVSGRMESRKSERDGKTTTYWDVVASEVNGLDRPKADDADQTPRYNRPATRMPSPPPLLPGEIEDPFAE